MPIDTLVIALIPIAFIFVVFFVVLFFYKKVEDGQLLVINGVRGYRVSSTNTLVLPFLEKCEVLDISAKPIIVNLTGGNGLLTKDNYIFDLQADFSIRVHPEKRSVLQVAQHIGVEEASSQEALYKMFASKFSEVLRMVAGKFDLEEVKSDSEEFKVAVLSSIPRDLNGFALDDLSINYIPSSIRKLNL